jgi:serine/threonine protein kinase
LDHPNIIKILGVSKDTVKTAYIQSEKGYFFILDVLHETLNDRLKKMKITSSTKWFKSTSMRRSTLKRSNTISTLTRPIDTNKQSALLERISPIVLGIANGLEYLHSHNIVLRDLKPHNVGFTKDGTVKLFDLGFAREVNTLQDKDMAGSFRYMAPEVGLQKGTTLKSDVYSFGVLLWELCTLQTPYKHIQSGEEFLKEVFVGDWRESTSDIPSKSLRQLIEECWQPNPERRPTMERVVKVLRVEFALNLVCKESSSCANNSKYNDLNKYSSYDDLTAAFDSCDNTLVASKIKKGSRGVGSLSSRRLGSILGLKRQNSNNVVSTKANATWTTSCRSPTKANATWKTFSRFSSSSKSELPNFEELVVAENTKSKSSKNTTAPLMVW